MKPVPCFQAVYTLQYMARLKRHSGFELCPSCGVLKTTKQLSELWTKSRDPVTRLSKKTITQFEFWQNAAGILTSDNILAEAY
jgi:hypothetical protein